MGSDAVEYQRGSALFLQKKRLRGVIYQKNHHSKEVRMSVDLSRSERLQAVTFSLRSDRGTVWRVQGPLSPHRRNNRPRGSQ